MTIWILIKRKLLFFLKIKMKFRQKEHKKEEKF